MPATPVSSDAYDVLRDAIESLTEGFALYDEDAKLVMYNARYAEMNGLVADLLVPGLDYEIMLREMARRGGYADAVGQEEAWVSERLENSMTFAQDDIVRHANGSIYKVSIHPTNLGGFVVTRTDITERHQAEEIERESDLVMRQVLEASPAAVVMARVGSGELVYRSPAAINLLGKVWNAHEFFLKPEDRADYVTALLADDAVDEYRLTLRRADGESFPALLYGRLVDYKGEELVVTTIIDLTKQVEAEAMIRKVLDACPVPIVMSDVETGDVLFSSPSTTDLLGPAKNVKSFYVEPEERDVFVEALLERKRIFHRRARLYNGKKEPFWCDVSSQLIDFRGRDVIVSNTRDLTDDLALEAELQQQREMLFQNEKMSALGELLAGVAHELNNPLSVVVGHILMLKEDTEDSDVLRRLDKIGTAAERCAKIVKTFLAMARQQPTKMELTDLSTVVATAVDVVGYGKKQDGVEIRSRIPDGLPPVKADSDQIIQVVINLIMNAAQAITSSGVGDRIKVTAKSDRGMVQLRIKDNGPGIPEKIRGRVFEPFFTTKEVGEGTGIGLAFCHRIVHTHGGRIWLDDSIQQGTKFCIDLPCADPDAEVEVNHPVEPSIKAKRQALVVDDEVEVADLISELLERDGWSVQTAYSGDEAINRLRSGSYDVLLSDLNMPGVDGRALLDRLEGEFPDMVQRCAFITGDTMGKASQSLLKRANRPFLEKPVSPGDLRKLINALTENTEGAAS